MTSCIFVPPRPRFQREDDDEDDDQEEDDRDACPFPLALQQDLRLLEVVRSRLKMVGCIGNLCSSRDKDHKVRNLIKESRKQALLQRGCEEILRRSSVYLRLDVVQGIALSLDQHRQVKENLRSGSTR